MNNRNFARILAAGAVAVLLAACGGGGRGGAGIVPTSPVGGSPKMPSAATEFKAVVPLGNTVSSGAKKGQYISALGTSSLVVSVTPSDPAEAAQWSTLYGASGFTVCYNLFNNGAIVTTNPNVQIVVAGNTATVQFPFPSPPGQDAFVITQYAGACSSTNPYAAPTPPPGLTSAQQIMSQSPTLYINVLSGQANNFNTQLAECNTPVGGGTINQPAPVTCSVPNPPCAGTCSLLPTLGTSVAFVYMAKSSPALPVTLPATIPLPVTAPLREVGAFASAPAKHVGVPIPIVGLDATGNAIPFTAGTPPSSGTFPKARDGISITHTEVGTGGNHFTLYLVDATTGAIAQNAEPITITQLNALNATDAKVGGTVGDPYVLVAAFDGSSATASTSATVSMAATINGAAQTAQTLSIAPQSALFTAVAGGSAPVNGYADAAAPYTKAADIINTTGASGIAAGGQGYWVTDGGSMHLVGSGSFAVTGATALTGETLFNNANITAGQILAVDNSQAANPSSGGPFGTGSGTPVNSGVYVFDPVAHTSKPLAVQWGNGNYVAFGNPQAIAFMGNPTPPGYAYVAAGNSIYAIDLTGNGTHGLQTDGSGNFYLATLIRQVPVTGLNAGTDTGFDMFATGSTAGTLILADTGNNRVVSVNVTTGAVTSIASGAAFVGLAVNGTGYVATDTKGQIYTISSSGIVTSLGLSNASAPKDGVVGSIGTTPLAPVPYTTQGQASNFFGSASTATIPYNIAPFAAAGPVFAAAAQTAVASGTLNFGADTSNATFGSTAGNTTAGFGIAFISAAGTNTALTTNSYLFTDDGALRTLVP